MKKVNFLVLTAGVAAFGLLATSCGKNEEPVITLASTSTTSGAQVYVGDSIIYDVEVSDDKEVKEVSIADVSGTTLKTVSIGAETGKAHFAFLAEKVGTVTYTISVVDKKDTKTSQDVTAEIVLGFKEHVAKMVFAPLADNSSKTFYSSQTGETYTVADFATNSAKIDFGVFGGNTSKVALAAPSDYLTTAYDLAALYPTATKNATAFAKSGTSDFDAIKTRALIEGAYTKGTPATDGTQVKTTRIYNIAAGDVIAFKTAAGKYGVLKVKTVNATGVASDNGKMLVNNGDYVEVIVKVQE